MEEAAPFYQQEGVRLKSTRYRRAYLLHVCGAFRKGKKLDLEKLRKLDE